MYEVKLDGYRALLLKDRARVQIRSRKNNDLTSTYPGIVAAVKKLKAESLVLDGEIVALDAKGRPSFQALQHRFQRFAGESGAERHALGGHTVGQQQQGVGALAGPQALKAIMAQAFQRFVFAWRQCQARTRNAGRLEP